MLRCAASFAVAAYHPYASGFARLVCELFTTPYNCYVLRDHQIRKDSGSAYWDFSGGVGGGIKPVVSAASGGFVSSFCGKFCAGGLTGG